MDSTQQDILPDLPLADSLFNMPTFSPSEHISNSTGFPVNETGYPSAEARYAISPDNVYSNTVYNCQTPETSSSSGYISYTRFASPPSSNSFASSPSANGFNVDPDVLHPQNGPTLSTTPLLTPIHNTTSTPAHISNPSNPTGAPPQSTNTNRPLKPSRETPSHIPAVLHRPTTACRIPKPRCARGAPIGDALDRKERNTASQRKSRIRKAMAVVEASSAAQGFANNNEMLLELIGECEQVMGDNGLGQIWEGVKTTWMKKHGGEGAHGVTGVLYRRDEGILTMMPDLEVVKRELAVKLDRGEMNEQGAEFAKAVARLVGKKTGEAPTYQMVAPKEDLRGNTAITTSAREERVNEMEDEMPPLRGTAMGFGEEAYSAELVEEDSFNGFALKTVPYVREGQEKTNQVRNALDPQLQIYDDAPQRAGVGTEMAEVDALAATRTSVQAELDSPLPLASGLQASVDFTAQLPDLRLETDPGTSDPADKRVQARKVDDGFNSATSFPNLDWDFEDLGGRGYI